MGHLFTIIGQQIRKFIDFFYPPFKKVMPISMFRYGVTGVANMIFDWVLYFVIYNYALQHQDLNLGFITLSSIIAALALSFPISLMTGFLLQKYVTFSTSSLKGRTQLVRYISVVGLNLAINYFGLKLLVDVLHFYPTPAKMTVTIFCTLISYFAQKKFTFKA